MSLAVIGVLIALLLPSLSSVRELARRVVCASNARQHGMAMMMYADDYQGELPTSQFDAKFTSAPAAHQTLMVRTPTARWDGMGVLFENNYLNAPQVFYCPSHSGENPYTRFADLWPSSYGPILTNYQYRGSLSLATSQGVMLTDGMRTQADFNHKVGANLLRTDSSVQWFTDSNREFARTLPVTAEDVSAGEKVEAAWEELDEYTKNGGKPEKN